MDRQKILELEITDRQTEPQTDCTECKYAIECRLGCDSDSNLILAVTLPLSVSVWAALYQYTIKDLLMIYHVDPPPAHTRYKYCLVIYSFVCYEIWFNVTD